MGIYIIIAKFNHVYLKTYNYVCTITFDFYCLHAFTYTVGINLQQIPACIDFSFRH